MVTPADVKTLKEQGHNGEPAASDLPCSNHTTQPVTARHIVQVAMSFPRRDFIPQIAKSQYYQHLDWRFWCRLSTDDASPAHLARASKLSSYGARLLEQDITLLSSPDPNFAVSWCASGSIRKQMHTPPFNPTF
jgi:hypothetical protein